MRARTGSFGGRTFGKDEEEIPSWLGDTGESMPHGPRYRTMGARYPRNRSELSLLAKIRHHAGGGRHLGRLAVLGVSPTSSRRAGCLSVGVETHIAWP